MLCVLWVTLAEDDATSQYRIDSARPSGSQMHFTFKARNSYRLGRERLNSEATRYCPLQVPGIPAVIFDCKME